MKGEVLASRALALATVGRLDDAAAAAGDAATVTRGIEAQSLYRCVRAACAVKARRPDAAPLAEEMLEHAWDVGAVDLVVGTYRGNPELIAVLLQCSSTAEKTIYMLRRADDLELAERLGSNPMDRLDPSKSLSPREREVLELVQLGLSNAEIAKRLFISESTVKVHVHHVFDKLGVRSRTALALAAAGHAAPRSDAGSDAVMTE
jgi:DNA-binding CsgD family transcriptional regulator